MRINGRGRGPLDDTQLHLRNGVARRRTVGADAGLPGSRRHAHELHGRVLVRPDQHGAAMHRHAQHHAVAAGADKAGKQGDDSARALQHNEVRRAATIGVELGVLHLESQE